LAKSHLVNALMLFPLPDSGWRPQVFTCSAVTREGLNEIWENVEEYMRAIKQNGYFTHNRNKQGKYWMYETINEGLRNSFYHDPTIESLLPECEQRVLDNKKSSFVAAKELLGKYFDTINKNQ